MKRTYDLRALAGGDPALEGIEPPRCEHCEGTGRFAYAKTAADHPRWVCACGADVFADAQTLEPTGVMTLPPLRAKRDALRNRVRRYALRGIDGLAVRSDDRRGRAFRAAAIGRGIEAVRGEIASRLGVGTDAIAFGSLSTNEALACLRALDDVEADGFDPFQAERARLARRASTAEERAQRAAAKDLGPYTGAERLAWDAASLPPGFARSATMLVDRLWEAIDDGDAIDGFREDFAWFVTKGFVPALAEALRRRPDVDSRLPRKLARNEVALRQMGVPDGFLAGRPRLRAIRRLIEDPDVSREDLLAAVVEAFAGVWAERLAGFETVAARLAAGGRWDVPPAPPDPLEVPEPMRVAASEAASALYDETEHGPLASGRLEALWTRMLVRGRPGGRRGDPPSRAFLDRLEEAVGAVTDSRIGIEDALIAALEERRRKGAGKGT